MRPVPSLCLAVFLLGACLSPITAIDSGPLSLDSPCSPSAEVDACMAWGYTCTAVDAGFSCQYPEFGDSCFPSVGCDPNAAHLTCDEFTIDGGPQAVFPACGTPCNVPTDCPDSTATCYQAYLGDGGLVGACLTNFCDTAYTSCNVGDAGPDGTCLPIGNYGDTVCNQTGPVPTNGPCSGAPIDAGAYLCQPGDLCSFGPSGQTLLCLAICAGGMPCPGSTSCVEDYGLCLTPCNFSDPNCSSPFTCQHLIAGTGQSVGDYCALP